MRTINSPPLTQEQVLNEISPDKSKSSEKLNVLPAFVLTGFFGKMAPRIEKSYETNQTLLERFDGCKAKPGMAETQVQGFYGKPLNSFVIEGEQFVEVFGSLQELDVNPALQFSCVAVVFDREKRVRDVYSHDFFNEDWKSSR
jgi:hypothetical protein